jgi:hypothetical protein
VAAFRHNTSCELRVAIPIPLNAGPITMPRLVVVCSKALADVYWVGATRDGIDAVKVGPKTALAIACKATSTYRCPTVNVSVESQQGTSPMTIALTTSEEMRRTFLGSRSTATPIKGASTIAGTVCNNPMILVLRGDPVTE